MISIDRINVGCKREHTTWKTISWTRRVALCCAVLVPVLAVVPLWGWGSTTHAFIIDAALTSIPADDQLAARLGGEARHLRQTVQMGDWMNSLVIERENWLVTKDEVPQITAEYFGNDYLLFPQAPHFFRHDLPQVRSTYRPYFLRALQALRTEDQANAARWMGSLLHFATDSGSPPHAISLGGPNHTKMENWLDASKIDLHGYLPVMLGSSDEEALAGLDRRLEALMKRNAEIGRRMMPYAEANDRAALEPLAMDCAQETAKVAADLIHTLMQLSAAHGVEGGASLTAYVEAPPIAEHPHLPAKLMLIGTSYSTLSEEVSAGATVYTGSFSLQHLPAGTYRAAIEREGAETLLSGPIKLEPGRNTTIAWRLNAAEPAGNLVLNPDLHLHWVASGAPDHWRFDESHNEWVSDNIPVFAGRTYLVSADTHASTGRRVELEWMAQHWLATTDRRVAINAEEQPVVAPAQGVYARLVIQGSTGPENFVRRAVLRPAGAVSPASAIPTP